MTGMNENQTEEITYSNIPPIKDEYENEHGENFTREEWAYFMDEINKQIEEGNKKINFARAVNNARYMGKLDEAFKDDTNITLTFEELERFMNEIRKI